MKLLGMPNETKDNKNTEHKLQSLSSVVNSMKEKTFVANAIFTFCSTRLHLSALISCHYDYEPRTHMFFMVRFRFSVSRASSHASTENNLRKTPVEPVSTYL